MDAARAEAARTAQDAKTKSGLETEAKVKAAADKINLKVEAAQGAIRDALASARAEIEAVAAEATQEMVRRVAGLSVAREEAAAAVKAELNV
jgi:F-type H+-transporting ATPase subunit b